MDFIFKEGKLYLHGAKFGKRTWRKVWVVLFKPSATGVGRLELSSLIENNAPAGQKKICRKKITERKVVRLSDCLSVIPAPKESCPPGCTAFYIHTIQSTYTLASTASQDWLSALCLLAFQKDPGESDKGAFDRGNSLTMEDNDLYSSWRADVALPPNQYQVTVQSTEASRRCQLSGEYLISPEQEAVSLLGVNTGHTFYRWPYRLLRKFGQVEGGFSIEAGRRCESGEGVFVFLSNHGPQIFQAISEQCCAERSSHVPSIQSLQSLHRRSLSDQSPVILPTPPTLPAGPAAVYSPNREDESADLYSTINHSPALNAKRVSLVKQLSNSREDVGEDQERRCHSLDAVHLDSVMDDSIYSNVRRARPPMIRYNEPKPDMDSECVYADVKVIDSPSNPRLQPFSPPLPPPIPPPLPPPLPPPIPPPLLPPIPPPLLPPIPPPIPPPPTPSSPKPRYQRQPPAINYTQAGYNAQAQAVDDMKEMEEAISSSARGTPTEAPGSFKHRLAEIISKDLAKLQPALPSGAGSPTFPQ